MNIIMKRRRKKKNKRDKTHVHHYYRSISIYSLGEYSDENMMDASNLASCLAPSLMPIPDDKDQVQYLTHTIELIRTMIIYYDDILPVDGHGTVYEKFLIAMPM
jgi:hypothetical protein